jgi:hypothetical protein
LRLVAALTIAPAAGAVVYVEGTGEPSFTNSTTNTQWVKWQGTVWANWSGIVSPRPAPCRSRWCAPGGSPRRGRSAPVGVPTTGEMPRAHGSRSVNFSVR